MKNVLVTGGAGFIGSHLVTRLLDRGYSVRVLDNLSFGKAEWVDNRAELIVGDIQEPSACAEAVRGRDAVFHCAAMSRSGPSLTAISECTQQNVVGTENVLNAARHAGVRKVIYSGSSTYYGNQPAPQVETLPPDFLNFYGLTKKVGEDYCLLFDRLYGLPAVVLRYFNVYGPRQPETGAYALVLGIFLRRWLDGLPLEIHGSGEQRRDFVHVDDIADANIAALESPAHGVVLNVGTGTNISVKELADMISSDQVFAERRAGDADITLADISRIREVLGWEPKVDAAAGIEQMKRYVRSAMTA